MEGEVRSKRRRQGQFQISFDLQCGEEEILTLQLICHESQTFFSLTINSQFIKDNSDMSILFVSPSSLYYTLNELFNELEIDSAGIITLRLSLSAAKVNLTKIYEFKMVPWPEGQLKFLRLRLNEQQQESAAAIASKQEQILSLKASLQEKDNLIIGLREKSKENNIFIDSLNVRIRQLQIQLEQINSQLLLSQAARAQLEDQRQELQAELMRKEQFIVSTRAQDLKVANFHQKLASCVYQANPQIYHFHYSYSSKGIKVTKKSENGWSNFMNDWPLSQNSQSSFTFHMNKMRDGSLAVGVGSEAVASCSSLDHPEFVGYLCRDGRIYEGNNRKVNGIPVLPDQDITIAFSRGIEGGVSWRVEGVEAASAALPISLIGKRLFLIVKVFWKEDEFELQF